MRIHILSTLTAIGSRLPCEFAIALIAVLAVYGIGTSVNDS